MKKFSISIVKIVTTIIMLMSFAPQKSFAEGEPSMMDLIQQSNYSVLESDKPKSAVLIDANTGKLLWSENPDTAHNPASIMKLMTLYLTYEAIEKGKFDLDTKVTATARHQEIANIYEISNNNIIEGVEYPVKELIPMALVPSSNVATMMLAELVEPDATVFLKMMNDKAQELGMTNTKIVNATGAEISAFRDLYAIEGVDTSSLDVSGSNVTTARDFAIFTFHLLKNYSEILEFTKNPSVTTMAGTPYEETFTTYNYSVPGAESDERDPSVNYHLEGTDGLKTGSSPSGAFNIDITAKRGDLRLIAIVFGVGDWSDQTGEFKRHPFANSILNYGFNNFEVKEVLPAGEQTIDNRKVIVEAPLVDTVKKGETPKIIFAENKLVVENNLIQVSEKIEPVSVKFEEEKGLLDKESKKDSEPDKRLKNIDLSHPITKKIVIIMSIILGVILLMIVLLIRDNRKRKKARQKRRERNEDLLK